jgi:transcriptional regulator with XRE-family HTH domain
LVQNNFGFCESLIILPGMNEMNVIPHADFAAFKSKLLNVLAERCQRNPRYSLRSFARSLGISHGALSEILSNRRPLSSKMVSRLGTSLGMSPLELKKYLKPAKVSALALKSKPYHEVDPDQFTIVADWYHYAILEALKVPRMQTAAQIARFLQISQSEVQVALERMEKLKFIQRAPNGKILNLTGTDTTTENNTITTVAMRAHQKQLLEKSLDAVEQIIFKNRAHSSTIMAIDPRRVDEARDLITKFKRDLEDFLIETNKLTAVYAVQVGVFPLSKLEDEK